MTYEQALQRMKSMIPVTLIQNNILWGYYDYVGEVQVERNPADGSIRDVSMRHLETGETLCQINKKYFDRLAGYDGKAISFRGRCGFWRNARVTPHMGRSKS